MNDFFNGWYLIYTRPRHEKKVYSRLAEMQINSFLPTRKILRKWHDRKKYVEEPLFPSYVFVYLKDICNYYDGLDVEGALYFVKDGKRIAKVDDAVVNNIKITTSGSNDIELSDDHFHPGKKMVINYGVLTGLSCELIRCENKEKLLVRVELLHRNVLLSMPEKHLMEEV